MFILCQETITKNMNNKYVLVNSQMEIKNTLEYGTNAILVIKCWKTKLCSNVLRKVNLYMMNYGI